MYECACVTPEHRMIKKITPLSEALELLEELLKKQLELVSKP